MPASFPNGARQTSSHDILPEIKASVTVPDLAPRSQNEGSRTTNRADLRRVTCASCRVMRRPRRRHPAHSARSPPKDALGDQLRPHARGARAAEGPAPGAARHPFRPSSDKQMRQEGNDEVSCRSSTESAVPGHSQSRVACWRPAAMGQCLPLRPFTETYWDGKLSQVLWAAIVGSNSGGGPWQARAC